MCTKAGLKSCNSMLQVISEPGVNMIAGSPEEYAARMWRSCIGSPFAPAEKLLSPEVLQSLRPLWKRRRAMRQPAQSRADSRIPS